MAAVSSSDTGSGFFGGSGASSAWRGCGLSAGCPAPRGRSTRVRLGTEPVEEWGQTQAQNPLLASPSEQTFAGRK